MLTFCLYFYHTHKKKTFYRLFLYSKSSRVVSIPVKSVPLSVCFNNSLSLNGVKNHKGQKYHPLKGTGKVALFA